MSHRPLPGRRSVLRGSLAASAALTLPTALGAAPAFARSGRPGAGWGVQTGDVTSHSGLVWVRSNRPARMIVETSATESFRHPHRWHGPLLGGDTDFTGTTRLRGPAAGRADPLPRAPRRPGRPAPHRRAGHRHLPHRAGPPP
ncbi:phosphodiesterase/alkaline phosphatase D-like protein [Streptomyces ambofaciens]